MQVLHRATSIHSVGRFLTGAGYRPGDFIRTIEQPPELLLDSSLWMRRDEVFQLAHELTTLTGDPLAVLRTLELFRLDEYGPWTSRLVAAGSLERALRFLCLNISALETGTRMSLLVSGDLARLQVQLVGELASAPDFYYEGALFNIARIVATTGEQAAVSICLQHQAHDLSAIETVYQAPVRFGAEHNEIQFPAELLALPLRAEALEPSDIGGPELTCREVNRIMQSIIAFERPTANRVADELSVNLRTLQRQLASWGFSFEELLDSYRRRRAIEQLALGEHSITDIALELGYSEAAHFTRAFRRWYGVPPSKLKLEGRGAFKLRA